MDRVLVAVALVVAVGVVLRFWTTSDLWLDEALTVEIARLPLDRIPDALRHDGAPPLYYWLLHFWTGLFGSGDMAARSLSGLFALAGLPAVWAAGRRLGGREAAAAATALLASSPFAIRFATEARMYSLVTLLTLLGYLALRRALEAPSAGRLALLSLVTGLALLTQYWTLYLLVAVGAVLAWRARRGPEARASRRCLAALAGGCVLFVPWLPSFLQQLAHTGTPWARPLGPSDAANAAISVLTAFSGGGTSDGRVLAVVLVVLVTLGLFGAAAGRWTVELDLRSRPGIRAEATVVAVVVTLAVLAGIAAGSAFEGRYLSGVFGLFVLVAAAGVGALGNARLRVGIVAVAVVLGLGGGVRNVVTDRTQGGDVARLISARARPGDVVVSCPDQLSPSVHRVLRGDLVELPFPSGEMPGRVDWVDYEQRNDAADPEAFADDALRLAQGRGLWLVFATGYRTFEGKCEALMAHLSVERPPGTQLVEADPDRYERLGLVRFPAPGVDTTATADPGTLGREPPRAGRG